MGTWNPQVYTEKTLRNVPCREGDTKEKQFIYSSLARVEDTTDTFISISILYYLCITVYSDFFCVCGSNLFPHKAEFFNPEMMSI